MADSIPVLHRARIFAQDRANREPRILFHFAFVYLPNSTLRIAALKRGRQSR
jgi:hypothetical protein